jgi:hypothetical protein
MGASSPITFNSRMRLVGEFATTISNDCIKNEPMFFNADVEFAREMGGPITQAFFDSLPKDWLDCPIVFDSRVHMLMPGWFPAIPGFHHDDVPRPSIPVGQHFVTAGQPDYDNPRYRSEHICGLVNAAIAPTNFAIGKCTMPAVPDGLIYRTWHNEVVRLIDEGELESVSAPDRQLIYFDCDDFHQGTKAVAAGWRWFGRISRNTDRTKTVSNEIRKQSQVYLEFPMEGW